MIWIDFDDIWQKYSEGSRIEFACFSFHVRLLVITLSSLKLHAENNACMLCASVSCWACLFVALERRRTLWIICETDNRWIPPPHVKFLLALRFVFLTHNSDSTIISTPVRLPLPGRLSTVLNFTSSLLMLFFVQPLFINSVINCRALWPLHSCRHLINILSSLLSGVKVAAFAWYSVKIRAIFGVRFDRREVDKKAKPTWKLNHVNSILETFEYLCQVTSKWIVTFSSYTVLKLGRFLRHSVYTTMNCGIRTC